MSLFSFRAGAPFDVKRVLDYHQQQNYDTVPYNYSWSGPVPFPANSEANYNAITWSDGRSQPSWTDISVTWAAIFAAAYNISSVSNADLQVFLDEVVSLKAASTHNHGQSDITGLSAALDSKLGFHGSDNYLKTASGNTDSSGELKVYLTSDGLVKSGSNTALFSGQPKVVPGAFSNGATDMNAPHPFVDRWENSGTTAVIKATKGHTQTIVLAANTDVADFVGSGVLLEILFVGVKA